MKRLETMLVFLALAATSVGADFNVRAFGAVGDGRKKDTAAVQRPPPSSMRWTPARRQAADA